VGAAIEASEPLVISVLYGDFEGGQRVISQFILRHQGQQCLVSAAGTSSSTSRIRGRGSRRGHRRVITFAVIRAASSDAR
jgi:hypothetical protein